MNRRQKFYRYLGKRCDAAASWKPPMKFTQAMYRLATYFWVKSEEER